MIVVDASVVIDALILDGEAATGARDALDRDPDQHAPYLIDLETTAALRRALFRKAIDETRARSALVRLGELPITRYPHLPLLPRAWELRHNLTPYDAAYVALAEALDVPLITGDARLAAAPNLACEVELAVP